MMPGGHLATSVVLSAGTYAATGSLELAGGCILGGFLIDVDHYADYLFFENQWRRPWPADFLRYYFTFQLKRVVLPLHSLELMAALVVFTFFLPNSWLIGYLAGAAMHLVFDMLVNGDHALKRKVLFYSFAYRATQGFSAAALLDPVHVDADAAAHPCRDFFRLRFPDYVKRAINARGIQPSVSPEMPAHPPSYPRS